MPREDLLALTIDDLAAMTNRGVVKRAQRELDAGDPTSTVEEEGERVCVQWSDGVQCVFPAGGTLAEATCSSGTTGISRHVIRSVLAYQAFAPAPVAPAPAPVEADDTGGAAEQPPPPPATGQSWDPGAISDEALLDRFGKRAVTKAQKRFADGVLVELIRSFKPFARFLDRPCVIRFLVPGDVRYVHSDCTEASLPEFVCHAVWAFRELAVEATSGVVATQHASLPVPTAVLDQLESLLAELCIDGVGRVPTSWRARLERCEEMCRTQGLVWPADLVADLLQQVAAYHRHDAQFDPYDLMRFVGELLIRSDAIRSGQTSVPQLLVRGSAADRAAEIAGSRLIGVGCDARTGKETTTITAYLQDPATGVMMAYGRTFANGDEADGPPKTFAALAGAVAYRGFSLSRFGDGQLLIKSGKRSPSHRITLPRTAGAVAVNPQSFAWEKLRPPHFVESFAEMKARLELLPPASLRPRRPTENVFICPLRGASDVQFDAVTQRLTARVEDAAGERAALQHRFDSRGRGGFERLAAALTESGDQVRFVSGQMSLARQGVEIRPLCLVFEDQGNRYAIQPWVDANQAESNVQFAAAAAHEDSPLSDFVGSWQAAAADVLVEGHRQPGTPLKRRWNELANDAAAVGFVRIAAAIKDFSNQLNQQSLSVRWDPAPAAAALLRLLTLLVLTDDLA